MAEEYGDDRLVFRLSADGFELDRLGEGFAGLARQFRRHLENEGVDPDHAPSKLFVTRVESGSLEFEVAGLLTLYSYLTSGADGYLIWTQFFDKIRRDMDYLAGRIPRPIGYSRDDAKDYDSFLRTVSGKRGAAMNMKRAKFHKRTGNREILAEFDFNERDLANADLTLAADLSNFSDNAPPSLPPRHRTERGVPFIWYRTDRDKGKASGQTSDRGIIGSLSEKALPVYFASEVDNHKDQMTKVSQNPFGLVYLVDVSIEMDDEGQPRSYTILNIRRTVESDD